MNNERSSSLNRNLLFALLAVVILGGLGYFLLSNRSTQPATESNTPSPQATQAPEANNEEATNSGDVENVKELKVESSGLSFTPKELRVKVGDRVRVTYKNNMATHDWTLDEFNVKTKLINAGQTDTVEFVASKAGSFEYYCSVPGHRLAGMKGTLVVDKN